MPRALEVKQPKTHIGHLAPALFGTLSRMDAGHTQPHPEQLQSQAQAGVEETGVSVAYTVLACDAGPILAAERMKPGDEVQAPALLEELFERGAAPLIAQPSHVFRRRINTNGGTQPPPTTGLLSIGHARNSALTTQKHPELFSSRVATKEPIYLRLIRGHC